MPTPTESYQLARENKARLDEGDKRMARIESKVDKYAERSAEQHIEQTRMLTRIETELESITKKLGDADAEARENRHFAKSEAMWRRIIPWAIAAAAAAFGVAKIGS